MGLAFTNVTSFSKLLSVHSLNLTLNHVLNMLSPLNYISLSQVTVSLLLLFKYFFRPTFSSFVPIQKCNKYSLWKLPYPAFYLAVSLLILLK